MIKAEDIKKILTIDDYKKVLASLGATIKSEDSKQIIYSSICHHKNAENHKKKLYFYKKTKSFFCYSCTSAYDLFALVQKRKELLGESCFFPNAIKYICDTCGIACGDIKDTTNVNNKCDWQSAINKYNRYSSNHRENTIYDKSILDNLSNKYYQGWINENISIKTQEKFGIKFYDYKQQICIPIYDDEANFVGVHCRNLNPEAIENGYKYMPFMDLAGNEYSFNISNILYGLNMNKENIRYTKTAVIFEAPKSVLMYESISDVNNSVALFGMNIQKIKKDLLLKYGCEHYIIALDRQYRKQYKDGNYCNEFGDTVKARTEEYDKYLKIIYKIVRILQPYGKVEIILDTDEDRLLDYKDAPVDKGQEIWEKLYNNRKEWKDIE